MSISQGLQEVCAYYECRVLCPQATQQLCRHTYKRAPTNLTSSCAILSRNMINLAWILAVPEPTCWKLLAHNPLLPG